MNHKFFCPICQMHQFTVDGDFSICKHCGWVNDSVMNADINYSGGANELCQVDFRLRYEYYLAQNPKYHWAKDGFPEIEQIEPMDCPVCKKWRFEKLNWEEIYCGKKPSDKFCFKCGWHYDINQIEMPNLKQGVNPMSLNEYKEWYVEKIKENPEYEFWEEMTDNYIPTPHKCPVCNKYEFKDVSCYDICSFCGWEDDGVQLNDPDFDGGANELSLNQYKEQYRQIIRENPNYKWINTFK